MERRHRREPSIRRGRLRSEGHEGFRNLLRVLGPILIVVGILFIAGGMVSFFSAFTSHGSPDKFWMCFVGMPILAIGLFTTKIGFMGAAARYIAGEIAPVGKDTINYMARGTRDSVREITSAVAEGIRGDGGSDGGGVRCPKCNEENDADARFCKECGAAIATTSECPECGELNDPDANFCDNCGTRMG